MTVLKTAGKIMGAKLTSAERTAMNMEIQKSFAEYDRKNANEIDATILWILHEGFGFGHDKLKKVHSVFAPRIKELCDRYEMTDKGDELWLCTYKLKEYGLDIEELNRGIE